MSRRSRTPHPRQYLVENYARAGQATTIQLSEIAKSLGLALGRYLDCPPAPVVVGANIEGEPASLNALERPQCQQSAVSGERNVRNKAFLFATQVAVLLSFSLAAFADEEKDEKKDLSTAYQFTVEVEIERTPVKNQYRTGTCWCFATISFLESELLRTGKGEFDLSEMFVVRNTYPQKADNFLRLHGTANFSQGGQAHDVMNCIRRDGLIPESSYSGMEIGEVGTTMAKWSRSLQP